eukprot:14008180-Ditylum_brightwellii.AAC.1
MMKLLMENMLSQHLFLSNRVTKVSLLQCLNATDVSHIESSWQTLGKMRLAVKEVKRLGLAAGVNTLSKTSEE